MIIIKREHWFRIIAALLGSAGIAAGTKVTVPALKAVNDALHPDRKDIQYFPEQYGLAYDELKIPIGKGKNLSGWMFTPEQNKTPTNRSPIVISGHGYGMNRVNNHEGTLKVVKELVEKGIACVLFDFQNHGESAKGLTSIGLDTEVNNMTAVIDYVKNQNYKDIGLMGLSMGAATVLNTAAVSPDVQAVIADSPYYRLEEYLKEKAGQWTTNKVKHHLVKPGLLGLKLFGIHPNQYSPIDSIKQLAEQKVPVVLVHNQGDELIPFDHSKKLEKKYLNTFKNVHSENLKPPIFTIYTNVAPEDLPEFNGKFTGHCRSIDILGEEYIRKIADFFGRYLGNVERIIPENQTNTLAHRLKNIARRTKPGLEKLPKENNQRAPEIRTQ